ncbi:DUF5629 family protein [Pseudomonas sp. sp1636]|uniref:DUF5629 family protein n=1 Tax=Pseudomonas sp. sp1636 TaxID=3036707 RepID=UPI0025A5873D|nr:DUF5629 family protein [Pseudomonas sp. sp1636]MDM8348046.1 DUF5629 family protein [Pseudomonas sp. sp1636]
MSTAHSSLIEALEAADMLEIDNLYAWQFNLDKELLAQVSAGSADADSQDRPLLSIDCIDGSARRRWQFSLAAVSAARFDAESDSWRLADASTEHRIKCFAAISGDNLDRDEGSQGSDG